jgi:hypothetical protein
MKTIREHLADHSHTEIGRRIQEYAANNWALQNASVDTYAEAVASVMNFANTQEGKDYWYDLYTFIEGICTDAFKAGMDCQTDILKMREAWTNEWATSIVENQPPDQTNQQ